MSEKEEKKREGSTSKYLNFRTEWQITLQGRKPPDQRVRNEIAKLKFRTRCILQSDTFTWEGNSAKVQYHKPVTGANMKKQVLNILGDCMKDFDANNFSFDFVFGQETRQQPAKVQATSSSAPSAPEPETTPVETTAGASQSFGSVPVVSATAGAQTQMRFKAANILNHAVPHPTWLPRKDVIHAKGCHGYVVFAFNKETKEDVAIKTLRDPSSGLDNKQTVAMFEEMEALFVASGHPRISKLLDVISTPRGLGLVLERLGKTMWESMQSPEARENSYFERFSEFQEAFAGLWSAVAFLAQRSLAHSDIKPANICEGRPVRHHLALCDLGSASLRVKGCHYEWPRALTESRKATEVCTLPYRAPELLFGLQDYGADIDVWSLGVCMAEAASGDTLFHHLKTEEDLRKYLRKHGDTTGDLSTLKGCPHGAEHDWASHQGDLIPGKASEFLGEPGDKLLQSALAMDPAKRITASAALALPFFTGIMQKKVWSFAVSAGSEASAVSAAPSGPDKTVLIGQRAECQLVFGHLAPDLLQELRNDPYWTQDHNRSWKAPNGHKDNAQNKRMKTELPAKGSCESAADQKSACKMQICGHCGEQCLRGSWNDMDLSEPLPVMAGRAFLEAFKDANKRIFEFLDDHLQHGPMKCWSTDELGKNGEEILAVSSRDWFGHTGSVQVTRLFQHSEDKHFDPGTAILLMVVTLDGERRLNLVPKSGPREHVDMQPGTVYITSACGIEHQVSYDGKSKTKRTLPDLGEVGLSLAFRTSLFRHSPYPAQPPGKIEVYKEFNRVLRLMHSKFNFILPNMEQYRAAYERLV